MANRGERAGTDQAVWSASADQHGLVTLRQLGALGLSRAAVQTRRDDGRLVPVQPGVFRVAGAAPTRPQVLLAACLSLGPASAVSHRCAAQIWGLDGIRTAPLEVLVPRPGSRRRSVIVHQSRDLRPIDVSHRGALPVTTPVRTLLDLGAVVRPYRLEQALDDAVGRRLVTLSDLAVRLREVARRGRRGIGPLRPLLEERLGLDLGPANTFEARAARLAAEAGLPAPRAQHPVDLGETTVYLDLAWPEVKLAVECDSLAHHFAAHRLRWDDRRQNALVLLSWLVLRLTWVDVSEREGATVDLLARAWRSRQAPAST